MLVGLGHLREVVVRALCRHVHALEPRQPLEDGALRLTVEDHLPLEVVVDRVGGGGAAGRL